MLELDGQMLSIKWRIVEKRLRVLRKTMDKDDSNLCKQALIADMDTHNGEGLLKECIKLCKELNISCTSEGNHRKGEIKNAVRR